jgi:hypothetical protein
MTFNQKNDVSGIQYIKKSWMATYPETGFGCFDEVIQGQT